MNTEELRKLCLKLPGVTEDIKWGNDLCFLVGEKMFCATGLEGDFGVSLKVDDEAFDELTATDGLRPAPYLARYKWILIEEPSRFSKKDWEKLIRRSYELIRDRLPATVIKKLKLG